MLKQILRLLILLSVTVAFGQKNHPKVLAIYPTTDSIPVNILRFYIQFSMPMQEMNILKHIKLTNENDKNITGVFFENQYELWNENRTIVTLIIDPGRVKLGLLANNKMGRAFDEGMQYTLTIDSLLLDFNDKTLENCFTKTFTAVKEDTLPPNTKTWELTLPKTDTKEAIFIDFNDNIDPISAHTLIKIFRNDEEIKGNISLENREQFWIFKPLKNWKKGTYSIFVSPQLEDIVANSVNQLFDHKTQDFNTNNKANYSIHFTIL